jgi:hypothetical protein
VPRTESPDDTPAQYANDLIISASVWRNGGSDAATHICTECLRVGVRAIKVAVSAVLAEMDDGRDKDAEIHALTQRLALLQAEHHRVCFDHDRMQDRLAQVIKRMDAMGAEDDQTTTSARWEVARGHIADKARMLGRVGPVKTMGG